MQRLKPLFSDTSYTGTISNVQRCLRLNDLEEIGDSTHYLTFHMLGFFSFRDKSVRDVIKFWLDFTRHVGLYPTHVTIHPDKMSEWRDFYPPDIEVRPDPECLWSDGNIGGYCTEFYIGDVEIGNIVNPLGTCIDVGFGVERLVNLKYGSEIVSREYILIDTIDCLLSEGVKPSPNKQGFILRKLLVQLSHTKRIHDSSEYQKVVDVQLSQYERYLTMTGRSEFYKKKSRDWWMQSFGVDVDNLHLYERLLIKHPKKLC